MAQRDEKPVVTEESQNSTPHKSDEAQKLYDECASIVNSPKRQERVTQWKRETGFYFNAQWEKGESDDLEATGQVDIVLNTLRRAIRTLLSQMTLNLPSAQFLPRHMLPRSAQDEQFLEEMRSRVNSVSGLWDHCWYISGGPIITRRAIKHQLVCGLGYLATYLDPQADFYRGELKFESRIPWEVVVPLNASDFDFNDAHRQFYRKQITLGEAVRIVGEGHRDLLRNNAIVLVNDLDPDIGMYAPDASPVFAIPITESHETDKGDDDLIIEWVECEEKIAHPAFLYKVETSDVEVDTIIYEPWGDATDGEEEIKARLKARGIKANISKADIDIPRVQQTTIAGREVMVSRELLPTSQYTSIPVIDEDTHNPLCYGEIFFVAPAQKLLNKVFSLAILHLQTSGSGDKLIGTKGAFGDTLEQVEAFQKTYTNPSSVTELASENVDEKSIGDIIMRLQATPLQPAAIQAISLITSWIDRLTLHPISWGDPSSAPRTASATFGLKEWGDEPSKIPALHLNYAMQRLGQTWLDRVAHHYTVQKSFGVPNTYGQMKQYMINTPQEGGAILNDIRDFKANIFIASSSTVMMNRMSILMVLKELMPIHPAFIKMFLLYSDIPEKFELIKEMDYTKGLEQQVEQFMPMVEKLQQELASKDEETQKLMSKVELTKLKGTISQITTKYREWLKYTQKEKEMRDQVMREQASQRVVGGGE